MLPCYKSVKILADFALALVLLVVMAPLMLSIGLILFLLERKVFFIQERPGHLGQPFYMYKFITMKDDPTLDESERITDFGRILRKLSLDELPQLWNIICGEMSFIGPRPFLMEYLPLYSEYHQKRHFVMPGITGLAQVTGKNEISWKDKLDMDAYYSDHINLILDLKIVYLTFVYFLRGCPGSYPASKFVGYN